MSKDRTGSSGSEEEAVFSVPPDASSQELGLQLKRGEYLVESERYEVEGTAKTWLTEV
jgi:hypothetical protein